MLLRWLAALAFVTSLAAAPVWTRFRGPNGVGTSDSKGLPAQFGKEKNLLWRAALPPGYSSPVLGEKCVFLTVYEDTKLSTVCVNRSDGQVAWKALAGERAGKKLSVNTPVSPTPVTDGKNVYVFIEHAGLISYSDEGKERWRLDLGKFNNPYGMGGSPILSGDLLVLQADQDTGSYLLAVDARTGKQVWKTERPSAQHGYSTPVVYQPKGQPAQLIVSESFDVAGYSLKTGERLWWVDGMAWQAKSVPVLAGDTLYLHSWMAGMNEIVKIPENMSWEQYLEKFDTDKDGAISQAEAPDKEMVKLWFLFDLDRSGKIEQKDYDVLQARNTAKSGLYAIRLGGSGNLTNKAVLWKAERSLPNIPSPLLYQDVLYVLKEGGILTSYDPKTGQVLKQGRVEGALDAYFASPIAADGKLFTVAKNGKMAVLKAAGQWEVIAVNDLDEETWATPAIEDGRLYVRTQSALYCFGEKSN
jgi:outer membrane protein assembly factor BamB